jgi:capsule polysaccharide export protein KpsE/RkpR
LPKVKKNSASKMVDLTDYSLLDSLQAQLSQAQADLAIAQAQNAADAQTIAALQAQVTSLQAQVAQLQSYISGLGLDKLIRVIIAPSYTESGGGIYVPPSYSDDTVNYTSVYLATTKIAPTYSTTGGGYP